jgi:hypothetical protein
VRSTGESTGRRQWRAWGDHAACFKVAVADAAQAEAHSGTPGANEGLASSQRVEECPGQGTGQCVCVCWGGDTGNQAQDDERSFWQDRFEAQRREEESP